MQNSLFNDAASVECRMAEMSVNNELERIRREEAVTYFEVQYYSGTC